MNTILFWLIIAGLFGGMFVYARSRDVKAWNGGKCACGGAWKRFDTDSQGGRGYDCKLCAKTIWISHPWVEGDLSKTNASSGA